ncbi:MAG: hypothetical protein LUH07_01945 [Lachnospiraceae bacterium]|nr:hypothetical protein [Lachnospiraceae bacterium]
MEKAKNTQGLRLYGAVGIALLVFTVMFFGCKTVGKCYFVADTLEVTWTNEKIEQVDLTKYARKEQIVKSLNEFERDDLLTKNDEHESEEHESEGYELKEHESEMYEFYKGDLDIKVKDNSGEIHYFHLSHEGREYLYMRDDKEYMISNGEELYQEVASAL